MQEQGTTKRTARPVEHALHRLLGQQSGAPSEAQVFSYHEGEDFRLLWSFEALDLKRPFVIFWKGFPSQPVVAVGAPTVEGESDSTAVDAFVTPYHWALTLARWCQSAESHPLIPRVWVFHAIPAANYDIWDGFGAQCRASRAQLPWLRGVCLATGLIDAYQHRFMVPIDELKRSIGDASPLSQPTIPQSLEDSLRSDISGDPKDHHSIANLIGPVSLARCLGIDEASAFGVKRSAQRAALTVLLTLFKWIDQPLPSTPFCEDIYTADFDPLEALNSVRYWLVDDQASMGYATVLATALRATELGVPGRSDLPSAGLNGCSLRWSSASHPDGPAWEVLAMLGTTRIEDWNAPREIARIDVLILDLRLWLDRPATRAAHPLRAVLDKAKALLASGDDCGGVLLPDFDRYLCEALSAAEAIVGKTDADYELAARDYSTELAAITLLPLLLSHFDPSLPIVIFSSTRQREVAKRLRHRPNIHLQFVKPGVGDHASATVTTRTDLRDAIRAALRQHQLRFVWQRIAALQLRRPEFPEGLRVRPPGARASPTFKCAEWRLDGEGADGPDCPETKRRLGGLYLQLLRGEINSLMSGCYELMESAFSTPEQKRAFAGIELVWPRHWHVPPRPKSQRLFRFSLLAVALQKIRNLKAHGLNLHSNPQHQEANAHLACAGMLIALIDFIEQKEVKNNLIKCPEPAMLQTRHADHFPDLEAVNVRPWELAALNGKTASDTAFIVYALSSVLHTVRTPGEVQIPASLSFASQHLVSLCAEFIAQEGSLGEAKKKSEPDRRALVDQEGDLRSLPIRLVGWSERTAAATYAQFVVPFRYVLETPLPSSHLPPKPVSWIPLADGLADATRLLNRDAERAFDDHNARFFKLSAPGVAPIVEWIRADGRSGREESVRFRPCAPELLLFASESPGERSPQRMGLLIVDVDFIDSSNLTLDDVLAFNAAVRRNISDHLDSKNPNALSTLKLAEILPGLWANDSLGTAELLQVPLTHSTSSRPSFFTGSKLKPLSTRAYVHSVVTVAGKNKGVTAMYEDVRSESGEAGEEDVPPTGLPQECADLYRLLTVGEPADSPKRNDSFTQEWLATRTYNRSASAGVCYAFDYNSSCLVVGDDDSARDDFAQPARTLYFLQWLHLIYMRSAISAFSESVTYLTRNSRNPTEFDTLHSELQQFENVHNFPFISDEGRSRDLYPKARAAIDLDEYLKELDKEVHLTTEYFNRQLAQRMSRGSLSFARVAAAFAFLALFFGFLGINMLDEDTLCAMHRSFGDQGTSYCEKVLKGKIQARLVDDLTDVEARRLDRLTYEMLCAVAQPVSSAASRFSAGTTVTRVAAEECRALAVTGPEAWVEWWRGSSRWVLLSAALLILSLVPFVIFAFLYFRSLWRPAETQL